MSASLLPLAISATSFGQQSRVVGEIVRPPLHRCLGRGEGALIVQLSVGCHLWPSADGTRTTVGGRASTSGKRALGQAAARGPGDLLADVRQQLASGEPLDFLAYVSTLLAAVDPRGESPFERDRDVPESATLATLTESFAEVVLPETTALLAVLAELGPDELTRARARRALATRPHPRPGLAEPAGRGFCIPRGGEHACAR